MLSCVLKTKFRTAMDTPTHGNYVTATRKAFITVLRSDIKVAILTVIQIQPFYYIKKRNIS